MKTLIVHICRTTVAFGLGLTASFILLVFWSTHSAYVNRMGFAAIGLALALPSLAVLLSIPVTFAIYLLFKKIPVSKLSNTLFGIVAGLMLLILGWAATYNVILYKYDPISNKWIQERTITYQLNQYFVPDYKDRNFPLKPYHLEDWLIYSDPGNKFSIKYPPLLTYSTQKGSNQVSFFYKDIPPIHSTDKTPGNEVLTVVMTANPILDGQEQVANLGKIQVTITRYNLYVPVGSINWLAIGYRYTQTNDQYHSASSIRDTFATAMLQTLELK